MFSGIVAAVGRIEHIEPLADGIAESLVGGFEQGGGHFGSFRRS